MKCYQQFGSAERARLQPDMLETEFQAKSEALMRNGRMQATARAMAKQFFESSLFSSGSSSRLGARNHLELRVLIELFMRHPAVQKIMVAAGF